MKTPRYRAISSSIWLSTLDQQSWPTNVLSSNKARFSSPIVPPSADVFPCPCRVNRPIREAVGCWWLCGKCQGNVVSVMGQGWWEDFREMGHAFVRRVSIVLGAKDDFVEQRVGIWIGIWVEILGYFFSFLPSPGRIDLIYKFREHPLSFRENLFLPLRISSTGSLIETKLFSDRRFRFYSSARKPFGLTELLIVFTSY